MIDTKYDLSIQYLYNCLPVFHNIGSAAYKPGLENTIRLLNLLNNPQNKFKTIHVGGTNGKGSVSHMVASILQSAGYKVGLYTSPHLVDFRERIRINAEMIDKHYVVNFIEQNKINFDTIKPSFFEATMAMCFNYFADSEVDFAVIEVGLGGRLDSTNILNPILSVITNISFDHIGFLGDTLEKIAFEKAGIIKTNTAVVIGETLDETKNVFQLCAKQNKSSIYFADSKIIISIKEIMDQKMIVETSENETFTVGLIGYYQLKNIATVLTVIKCLTNQKIKIQKDHIRYGLENVCELTGFEGRWQKLNKNPVIVADTGHNVAGIKFVMEQLLIQKYTKLRIIIGLVNDKDVRAILNLLPKNAYYYFTQANIERALPAEQLQNEAERNSLTGCKYLSVNEAIEAAIYDSDYTDFIFIGGSNFVVGEALLYFRNIKNN